MKTQPICQHCRKPLGGQAIEGLCPECLMKMGLGVGTEASVPGTPGFHPPSIAELAPQFPQFELLAFVGQGGMGAVYKARQKQLGRTVALKILPPGIGNKPGFAERFTREAQAMARLNHPGIVTIHDFGEVRAPDAGAPAAPLYYLVMEFVDGVSLRQLLRAGRVSPREGLAIVPQICDALQYAHDHGIVHRDIKPENILLDRQGRVKVADFGLAKLVGPEPAMGGTSPGTREAGDPWVLAGAALVNLTEADRVMGTPQYMAPEQVAHPGTVDHRADIYALGVVLYQMLTGELPGHPLEPPSRKVSVDVRLDQVVLRALDQQPERRYQQVSEVKTAVERITRGPGLRTPAPARNRNGRARLQRPVLVGACAGLLVLLLIGCLHLGGNHTQTAALKPTPTNPEAVPDAYVDGQVKEAAAGNDWAKFHLWEAYAKGSHGVSKDPAQAERWLAQFLKNVSVVRFEPVKGFNPASAEEFLNNLNRYSPVTSGSDQLGAAGFFRTTVQGDKLVASFLSSRPDQLTAALAKNPNVKVLSVEPMPPAAFPAYEASPQESLPNANANPPATPEEYVSRQLKLAANDNDWGKYALWEAYAKGSHGVARDAAQAEHWLHLLVTNVFVVKFEPVNGFSPANPSEFLDNIHRYSHVYSAWDKLGLGSFFRTKVEGDKLIGSFLSSQPDQLKAALQKDPHLKVLSVEPMTPEAFPAYEASPQESLPETPAKPS